MMNQSYFDKILAYQEGELSDAERTLFETELKTNPELQEAYKTFQENIELTDVFAYEFMREKLKSWNEPVAKRVSLGRLISIAASALILIAFVGLWRINARYDNQSLAGRYYVEIPVNSAGRDGGVINSQIAQQNSYYQVDKYSEILASANTNDPRIHLIKAKAAIKLGENNRAIDYSNQIINQNQIPYVEAAEWLKIIAIIQDGDIGQAITLLDQLILQQGHPYREDARKLKVDLNSTWRRFIR